MSLPIGIEDVKKLKSFIDFCSSNPTVLNYPQLSFLKDFIEKLGGKVPAGEFRMPGGGGSCPFGGGKEKTTAFPEPDVEEAEMESEPESKSESAESTESDVELDMEGVIEPEPNVDQPMGDESKTPTDEEVEQASDMRSQAAAAYSEQKFQEAIDLYTKAIETNPGNALFHAKRGQAFLKLKKPIACIRDCDKALELNCDSAAAYKFRGRAHRLLGNWELAAKDLRQACKLDFDEEADEWLREVTPNAKKLEQHKIKQERKKSEKEMGKRQENLRKAQEAHKKAREQSARPDAFTGSNDGGFNFKDVLSSFQDPEVSAALQDIVANPANIEKYKSNPKIAKLLEVMQKMNGAGGMGGGAGGIPGMFPGFPGGFPGSAGATAPPQPPTAEKKESKSTKDDFVDDGLD